MAKRKQKKARRIEAANTRKGIYPPALAARNATISAGVASRYGRQAYTPYMIGQMDNKTVSSELSKARSILRKRYERGIRAGSFTPDQAARIRSLLAPVRSVPVSDRPEQLSLIARELSRETSTISGARARRQKVVEDFHNAGFNYINAGNLDEFLQFVNEFTAEEKASMYGSDVLYDYYKLQKEKQQKSKWLKVSRRSFMRWLREREK